MFVRLMMAHFRPFKGRSSSDSSFHASLLQTIDVVMSLALCLQVVSQDPQHFRSAETQAACNGFFYPPVCLLGYFPSLRHVQRSTPTVVSEGGCRPLTQPSSMLTESLSKSLILSTYRLRSVGLITAERNLNLSHIQRIVQNA